jgi:hypothetical protein
MVIYPGVFIIITSLPNDALLPVQDRALMSAVNTRVSEPRDSVRYNCRVYSFASASFCHLFQRCSTLTGPNQQDDIASLIVISDFMFDVALRPWTKLYH